LIDLAWSLSKENAKVTEELAQIRSPKSRLAFAKFLASKGKGADAIEQFNKIGGVPPDIRKELVVQLLATNNYNEAFALWSAGEEYVPPSTPAIYDGGFEGSLKLEEKAFGWRVLTGTRDVTLSLDPNQPHSGAQSLRIEFSGESDPASPVVSQLVLVEPARTYRVNLVARTQEIVTGGPPIAAVIDAGRERKLLGKSGTFAKGTSDWTTYSFDFTTLPDTKAVFVGVQREGCSSGPCPAFGSIVIDSFSIQPVK
ncbi:MAG TPA: carbohydrate binding domain-containing protein, partial [Pyrinomonadaceae bacterium]|nr:carbohydrate binding domain-containing protein [Pyrinomonadaceae bacterium]